MGFLKRKDKDPDYGKTARELREAAADARASAEMLKKANNAAASQRRKESAQGFFKGLGKLVPKGVRDPNKLVQNRHLYTPGGTGRNVFVPKKGRRVL